MATAARTARPPSKNRASFDMLEAIRLCRAFANANFDETLTLAINLNLDVRKPGQNIRSVAQLPYSFRTVRVAVFTKGIKVGLLWRHVHVFLTRCV